MLSSVYILQCIHQQKCHLYCLMLHIVLDSTFWKPVVWFWTKLTLTLDLFDKLHVLLTLYIYRIVLFSLLIIICVLFCFFFLFFHILMCACGKTFNVLSIYQFYLSFEKMRTFVCLKFLISKSKPSKSDCCDLKVATLLYVDFVSLHKCI